MKRDLCDWEVYHFDADKRNRNYFVNYVRTSCGHQFEYSDSFDEARYCMFCGKPIVFFHINPYLEESKNENV